MLVSFDKPDYPLWYCYKYPVALLHTSEMNPAVVGAFPALLEDISRRGLINPLIVLNHRDSSRFRSNWVMTGRNRLHAVRALGWGYVPALVTGDCPIPALPVEWAEVQDYFQDGAVYLGPNGPRLRGMTRFEKGEFP